MFSGKRFAHGLAKLAASSRATVPSHRILLGAAAVTLTCLLLSGCGGGSSPVDIHGDGTSGFRGVARVMAADGTLQGPLPNAIITVQTVYSDGITAINFGPILAQTHADAQGNYTLELKPGVYGIGGDAVQPGKYSAFAGSLGVSKSQFRSYDVPFNAPAP